MSFKVGAEILSREKHRGRTVTIHEPGGRKTVLGLKYEGTRRERNGRWHVYRVVAIGKTSAAKGER